MSERETRRAALARVASSGLLIALIALVLAWEGPIAPARPGGSWLILKALPLLAPLFGILRGKLYTYRWATFLALAYFAEGVMRATTPDALVRALAVVQVTLSIAWFATLLAYVRLRARPRN